MKVKTYKNGNFTVKSMGECAPYELAKFAQWLCNNLPEDMQADVDTWDTYTAYVICKVNGAKRYYPVTEYDMDNFRNWKTVRFVAESLAPMFTLPNFYMDNDVVWDGVRGTVFYLCNHTPEDARRAMEEAGCKMCTSHSEYAPEMRREAVFVPRNVCFSYC